MPTTVTITKRGVQRVRVRHCWIYRSDMTDANKAQPGDVVRVADARGRMLGSALYSSRSQIAIRMISFEDVEIDRDFWRARLASAEVLRDRVVGNTTASAFADHRPLQ